jgi:hypothetical protein
MKASVIVSMSMVGIGFKTAGPVTVVVVSVCKTSHPITFKTLTANSASPCSEFFPIFCTVTVFPVTAANARGYVAEEASAKVRLKCLQQDIRPDSCKLLVARGIG